jgi:hypothetical protein
MPDLPVPQQNSPAELGAGSLIAALACSALISTFAGPPGLTIFLQAAAAISPCFHTPRATVMGRVMEND